MKKLIKLILGIFFIITATQNIALALENHTKVNFINTNQSDCTLIESASKNVLIDTGYEGSYREVEKFLKGKKINKLDLIIVTHYHGNNYGGVEQILKNFKVEKVLLPTFYADEKEKNKVIDTLKSYKANYEYIKEGWIYNYETINLRAILPLKKDTSIENNNSLVLKGVIDEIGYLFMGDCEKKEEEDLNKVKDLRNIDVIKIANHGLDSSTNIKFLSQTKPLVGIITSNGDKNQNKKVETRIITSGARVLRTDLYGDITVVRELGTKKMKIYTTKDNGKLSNGLNLVY